MGKHYCIWKWIICRKMHVFNLRFLLFGYYSNSIFIFYLPKIKILARHCQFDFIFKCLLKVVGDLICVWCNACLQRIRLCLWRKKNIWFHNNLILNPHVFLPNLLTDMFGSIFELRLLCHWKWISMKMLPCCLWKDWAMLLDRLRNYLKPSLPTS